MSARGGHITKHVGSIYNSGSPGVPNSGDLSYADKVAALLPAAYWILNVESGVVVPDATGNTPDATAANVTWGVDGIGDENTAGEFNGTTSVINVFSAALSALFNADEGSVAYWVWHDSAGAAANRGIYEFLHDANNRSYMLGRPNISMNTQFILGGITNSTSIPGPLPQDQWVHQAVVWSKALDYLRNYQAGVLVGAPDVSYDGVFAGPIVAAVIGQATFILDGRLAHFAVFDYPLLPNQVASLATV